MKVIIFTSILIFGITFKSKAQTNDSLKVDPLAKEYLLNHYGKNDTARAIIEYSFVRFKKNKSNLLIGLGLSALSVATYGLLAKEGDFLNNFSAGLLTSPILSFGLAFTIGPLIEINDLKPKKLNEILQAYFATGKLPKMFKDKKRHSLYKKYLPDYKK